MSAETPPSTSFPRFNDLPVEIRLSIWELAIPGPRIVEVVERTLKTTTEDVLRQVEEWEATGEIPRELKGSWKEEVGLRKRLAHLKRGIDDETTTEFEDPIVNIFSPCRPPEMISACRESHQVSSKYYERAFDTKRTALTFPQTYFDFDRDILYFRVLTRETIGQTIISEPFFGIRESVKNIAIHITEEKIISIQLSIEAIISLFSCIFTKLKSFILVPHHVGTQSSRAYSDKNLILSEPFDTRRLELLATDKNQLLAMPMLDLDGISVDAERLAVRRMKMCPLDVDIQYKIVIPEQYKGFIEYMQSKVEIDSGRSSVQG